MKMKSVVTTVFDILALVFVMHSAAVCVARCKAENRVCH
jgi:hypothetical protein